MPAILFLAVAAIPGSVTATSDLFDHHEIVTGEAEHQTVVSGFFRDGDTAEIAVMHIDAGADTRLQMFGYENGAWVRVLESALRPNVLFVDVANIGGRDRIISYEHGRLNWFDPATGAEHLLLDVRTNYRRREQAEVPRLEIARDINHDGRDDLVVPDVDGFWIATQRDNGSFTRPMKLGPPEPLSDARAPGEGKQGTYGDKGITAETNPWYQGRVHEMDYSGDGRSDLAFWNGDRFDVYLQNEQGTFEPKPVTFKTDVPFEADGFYTFLFGYDDESLFRLFTGLRRKTTRTAVHSIRDINGDDIADLVTVTLEGRSLMRQRSRYEVHFGHRTATGMAFERAVGTTVSDPEATTVSYSQLHFYGSGADGVFAMVIHADTGIGQLSRALLARTAVVDLSVYRTDRGRFPNEPNVARRIRPQGPRGGFPPTLIGDVTGDRHPELLVGNGRKELLVYPGLPEFELFASTPHKVAVEMPGYERHIWLADLTRDGRQGMLIYLPSDSGPNRVKILMPRPASETR